MAAGMDPRFMAATPSRPSGPKARGGLEHLRNTKEGKQLAARTEPRADGRLPRGSSSPQFQFCLQKIVISINPEFEAPTTPFNRETQASPLCGQLRI